MTNLLFHGTQKKNEIDIQVIWSCGVINISRIFKFILFNFFYIFKLF